MRSACTASSGGSILTDRQPRILLDEIDRAARRAAAASSEPLGAWAEERALTEKLEAILERLFTESVATVRRETETGLHRIDPVLVGEPYAQLWRRVYRRVLKEPDDLEAAA